MLIDKITASIQLVLDLWDVSYDYSDEKYVAKIDSNAVLNVEQIEQIQKLGFGIFSINKYDDTLIVRFSPRNYFS